MILSLSPLLNLVAVATGRPTLLPFDSPVEGEHDVEAL